MRRMESDPQPADERSQTQEAKETSNLGQSPLPTFIADTGTPDDRGNLVVRTVRAEIREHRGPLPDIEYFRELAEIYPDAPRIIIEDFQEQARHRRHLETMVVESNIVLSHRSQIFGFAIGIVGLVGSLIVVGRGYPSAGAAIATGCVLGLVTVFVLGRESQKRERIEKEKVRQRIRRGDPIEDLEPEEKSNAPVSLPERSDGSNPS